MGCFGGYRSSSAVSPQSLYISLYIQINYTSATLKPCVQCIFFTNINLYSYFPNNPLSFGKILYIQIFINVLSYKQKQMSREEIKNEISRELPKCSSVLETIEIFCTEPTSFEKFLFDRVFADFWFRRYTSLKNE